MQIWSLLPPPAFGWVLAGIFTRRATPRGAVRDAHGRRDTRGEHAGMRDPCVVRGPDGTFHLVWTSGWNENNIGDLKMWEDVRSKLVLPDEGTPVRMRHGTVIEGPRGIVAKLRGAR